MSSKKDDNGFVVRYTNKDIMDKLNEIHEAQQVTNGKVKMHSKLNYAGFSFTFAVLMILVSHFVGG